MAISYDAVEILRGFADKHGIAYTLLSDQGSKIISELGLLNERVNEQHAAYGIAMQDRHRGLPYPGVFLFDEHGRVLQKRFHQSYRERETGAGIIEQGFGITSATHGPEAHGQSDGVKRTDWVLASVVSLSLLLQTADHIDRPRCRYRVAAKSNAALSIRLIGDRWRRWRVSATARFPSGSREQRG